MEGSFPCLLERTVASALLILSAQPPRTEQESDGFQNNLRLRNSISCSSFFMENAWERSFSEKSLELTSSNWFSSNFLDNGSKKIVQLSNSESISYLSTDGNGSVKSVGLSNSKSSSCLSSLTVDDGSPSETSARRFSMAVDAARYREKKLKVARKSRTPIMRRSHQQNKISYEKVYSELSSSTAEASSCLSSGSSGGTEVVSKPKPPVTSASIRTRAEGIMRALSYGCASEVRLRQLLGDSPDTSKALRILLKKKQVRRSGRGGNGHPYIYEIA